MKRTLLSASLALAFAGSACVMIDDSELGEGHTAIQSGFSVNADAEGVALADHGCTLTLLTPKIALTTPDCATLSKSVELLTATTRIRAVHPALDNNRKPNANVVLVSLRKSLLRGSPRYARVIDTNPVQAGEHVTCVGYDGGKPRAFGFEVGDGAGGTVALKSTGGTVTPEDLGGFCTRDGNPTDPVLILTHTAPSGGDATAARLDTLGLVNKTAFELDRSVDSGSIRLLDDSETLLVTADFGARYTNFVAAATDDRTQAFFRVDLGSGQVRFVTVAGECLAARPVGVRIVECDASKPVQRWTESVTNSGGWDRYSYANSLGAITQNAPDLEMQPWTSDPAQEFRMWLAPY